MRRLLLLIGLISLGSGVIGAQITEASAGGQIQYFNWNESLSSGIGLDEYGLVVGAQGRLRLALLDAFLNLRADSAFFAGGSDYRGFSQSVQGQTIVYAPLQTTVDYAGLNGVLALGFHVVADAWSIEPFSGLGIRYWSRALQSTISNNVWVMGYTENWLTIDWRVGLEIGVTFNDKLKGFASGGVKSNFYNSNQVNIGVTVFPKAAWAAFCEIGLRIDRIVATVQYEGFRFNRSDNVTYGSGAVYQPQSRSDNLTLTITYAFF